MDAFTVILLVLLVAVLALLAYFIFRARGGNEGGSSLLLLQNQLSEIRRTLDSKLSESTQAIQSQFGESAKIIKEITQELTKVNEGHNQVLSITEQLRDLQDVLKNTKQRGMLGEYSLELILQNFFPKSYARQYKFGDGTAVDFVIKVREKVIPIDSKFSLENYQRILEAKDDAERGKYETMFKSDLKTRIDETSKYIKPEEGTMDFAFMFIPAEAIYYDLLINRIGAIKSNTRDMIEYAAEKHVIIVSPTTFLAYLQTVLQGLRALQIEESSKEISKWVEELVRHLKAYEEYMQKLDKSLEISRTIYDHSQREFAKVDRDIAHLSDGGQSNKAALEDREERE